MPSAGFTLHTWPIDANGKAGFTAFNNDLLTALYLAAGHDFLCGGDGLLYGDLWGNVIGAGNGGGPSGEAFGGAGVESLLDDVSGATPSPGYPATFTNKLLWLVARFLNLSETDDLAKTLKVFADDGTTVLTTQSINSSGTLTSDSVGKAS